MYIKNRVSNYKTLTRTHTLSLSLSISLSRAHTHTHKHTQARNTCTLLLSRGRFACNADFLRRFLSYFASLRWRWLTCQEKLKRFTVIGFNKFWWTWINLETSGVNFNNNLSEAFTPTDPKSAINIVKLSVFFLCLWDLRMQKLLVEC